VVYSFMLSLTDFL